MFQTMWISSKRNGLDTWYRMKNYCQNQTMWISSKTNSEFFTASTDGTVMWWDIRWAEYWSTIPLPDCDITSWSITLVSPRKFTSPVETLIIDPKATEDTGNTDKVYATNKHVKCILEQVNTICKPIHKWNECTNAAEEVPFITFATSQKLQKKFFSKLSRSFIDLCYVPPIIVNAQFTKLINLDRT